MKLNLNIQVKDIAITILIALSLTSCVSTKKYQQTIDVKSESLIPFDYSSNWITIDYSGDILEENIVRFHKNRVIPALFYYNWHVDFECIIKTETRLNNIRKGVLKESRLNNSSDSVKIHINILEIPSELNYVKKGFFAGMNLLFFGSLSEAVYIPNSKLVATYEVFNNDKLNSNGKIIIESEKLKHSNITNEGGQYKLSKPFVRESIKIYNERSEELGRELFKKILTEIKQ